MLINTNNFNAMSSDELLEYKGIISRILGDREYNATKKDWKTRSIDLHKDQEEDGKVVATVFPKDVILIATPKFYYSAPTAWTYSIEYKDAFYKVKGGKFTKKESYDHYHELGAILPDVRWEGKNCGFGGDCENVYSTRLPHDFVMKVLPNEFGIEVVEFDYEKYDDKGNRGTYVKDYYKDMWYVYITKDEDNQIKKVFDDINKKYEPKKGEKISESDIKSAMVEYRKAKNEILKVDKLPFDPAKDMHIMEVCNIVTESWGKKEDNELKQELLNKRFEYRKYFDELTPYY